MRLSLLAIVIGVTNELGAVLFRALIGLIHNVAFLGSVAIVAESITPFGE